VANTVLFLWISASLSAGPLPRSAGALSRAAGALPRSHSAGSEVPSASALAALRDFGAARGLNFVAVSADRPLGLPANDAALVDLLEGELEQARTALSALEESAAGERLSRVEAQLLSHPHLPQAGFLLGECWALQAQAAREQNPARARQLDERRLALEGPRAVAFGETASNVVPSSARALDVQGLRDTDELELDGQAFAAPVRHVTLVPGLHQARVWRWGRPIFATFTEVSSGQTLLALDVPAVVPCSAEDLQSVPRAPGPVKLAADIACRHWAEVREERGGIGVALCEQSRCGDFVHWQRRAAAPFAPIAVERSHWPPWAGFAVAGATLAVATGLVLWQSGAFDRGQPTIIQYEGTSTGSVPQGVRF
jgi:hypothetical protein